MNRHNIFKAGFCILLGLVSVNVLAADPPQWWTDQGVLNSEEPAEDAAAANQGQLMHVASRAATDFQDKIPGLVSAEIDSLISDFNDPGIYQPGNSFAAVNLGQLKYIAKPFYDVLDNNGLQAAWPAGMSSGPYPWTAETGDDEDDALANIGQLKYVFSFDLEKVLRIDTPYLPVAGIGASYYAVLTASSSHSGSLQWEIIEGTLPDDLELQSDVAGWAIIGTPSAGQATGLYAITLKVTNELGVSVSKSFQLYLNASDGDIAEEVYFTQDIYNGESGKSDWTFEGRSYSSYIWFELEPESYQFWWAGGALPPGVEIDLSYGYYANLTGSAAAGSKAASPYIFGLYVEDEDGVIELIEFTLQVYSENELFFNQGDFIEMHVDQNSPLDGPFNDLHLTAVGNDLFSGDLIWSILSPPQYGQAEVEQTERYVYHINGYNNYRGLTREVRYQPSTDYVGSDEMVVQVDDGEGNTASITVTITVGGYANTSQWGKINEGSSVGTEFGEDVSYGEFSTVVADDGSIHYSGRSENLGRYWGRLTLNKEWQLMTDDGWDDGSQAQPVNIEHPHNVWGRMDLYPHPDIAGGLFGFAHQIFRCGPRNFNVHGSSSHVVFDGEEFVTWNGGTDFDSYQSRAVINSWNGNGSDKASFDFDPFNREGIAVGGFGFYLGYDIQSQLVAARYDMNDAGFLWHRWHQPLTGNGHWKSNNSWPNSADATASRDAYILDRQVDSTAYRYNEARVTHIPGTRDYLVVFQLDKIDLNEKVFGAARYHHDDTAPYWTWWWMDTAGIQHWERCDAAESSFSAQIGHLTPNYPASSLVSTELVKLGERRVLLLLNAGGTLLEVLYDHEQERFGSPNEIAELLDDMSNNFVHDLRDDGVLDLVYVDKQGALRLISRSPEGIWGNAQLVYAIDDYLKIEPIAMERLGTKRVVFYSDDTYPNKRIYALGESPESLWTDEMALNVPEVPETPALGGDQYSLIKTVENMGTVASYSASIPSDIAIDDQGYIYAGRLGNCSMIVHPPNSMSRQDNKMWGGFWDYMAFPGPVAVYPEANKVFVMKDMVVGGGGMLTSMNLETWEISECRDSSFGWTRPDLRQDYFPQQIKPGAHFSLGMTIDRSNGILYVGSALENQILVYDVANGIDSDSQFNRASYCESKIAGSNKPRVQQIVADLVAAGYMGGNQEETKLWWINTDWDLVESFVRAHSEFLAMDEASNDQNEFMRNLMKSFKAHRDLPVKLYEYTVTGEGPGEFRFPSGLAVDSSGLLYVVDSENHRVQVFQPDHDNQTLNFMRSFGVPGRGAGELLYPLGISVSPQGEVFVSDPNNQRYVVFDLDGNFLYHFDSYYDGTSEVMLDNNCAVDASREGFLYINNNHNILTFERSPPPE